MRGGFILGAANVFTQAQGGFNFGTAGATVNATLEVLNGATLNTYQSTVSQGPGGPAANGQEHSVANVTVAGADSLWSVTQDPVSGSQARINMAPSPNATATVNVTNGGQMIVTGGTITSYIGVGDGGDATLNILSGGLVTVADMVLGNQTTGVGKGHRRRH